MLTAARHRWARLPLDRKLPYLDALSTEVLAAAEDWVAAAVRGKRIPPAPRSRARNGSPAPTPCSRGSRRRATRWARSPPAAARSTGSRCGSGRTAGPSSVSSPRPQGAAAAARLHGRRGDAARRDGGGAARHGRHVLQAAGSGGPVALVLGAGNIASIPPLDLLYKLFAEGEVVLVKLNPINDYLRPVFERAFAALIDDGFCASSPAAARSAAASARTPAWRASTSPAARARTTASSTGRGGGRGAAGARRARAVQARSAPSSAASGPPIVVPGPGGRPTSTIRRSTSPPRSSTTAATTASPRRCWCCRPDGRGATGSWTPCAGGCERWWTGRRTTAAAPSGSTRCSSATRGGGGGGRRGRAGPGLRRRRRRAGRLRVHRGVLRPGAGGHHPAGRRARGLPARAVAFCNETLYGTLGANVLIHPRTVAEIGDELDAAISSCATAASP